MNRTEGFPSKNVEKYLVPLSFSIIATARSLSFIVSYRFHIRHPSFETYSIYHLPPAVHHTPLRTRSCAYHSWLTTVSIVLSQ
jgi:hypothetical protein